MTRVRRPHRFSLLGIGPLGADGRAPTARAACAAAALLGALTLANPAFAESLQVRSVSVAARTADRAEVVVSTTAGAPQYLARVAEGGLRLVVDVEGSVAPSAPSAITDGNGVVAGVMTQGFQQEGRATARILVQLSRPAEYRIVANDGQLRIELAAAAKTAPMSARPPVPTGAPPVATPVVVRAPEPPPKPEPAAAAASARVAQVRFEHEATRDRVVIELSGAAAFTESSQPKHLAVELRGVTLPNTLQRKLDVSAFGGPIKSIATYRRPSDPSRVVVDVEKGDDEHNGSIAREGSTVVLTFPVGPVAPTLSGVAADGGAARKIRTVSREDDLAGAAPKIETTFQAAAGSIQQVATEADQADAFVSAVAMQQRRYTGRRIDLDLKDAPVQEVLRLISEVGRVNIVAGDNVTGGVTIRMRNVPWDQALETVLQAKGYGMVRQGNMIRVAPLAELNKERELAIARRKSELQLAPIETRIIPVSYAEAKEMQDRAKEMLSPRGSLAVDERTNVLIVRDVAGNLNQIEELIRSLDTQTPQVLIEARIVEATSRYLRDVGIQWGGDGLAGASTGNPTGLAFPSSVGVVGGASDQTTPTAGLSPFVSSVPNPNFAVNLPATVGTGSGGALGLSLGSIDNTVNLSLRLSAAESSGMVRIISNPRVLTLDNREAKISQGTLIPFSQISAQGVQTTFQEAKLQLLVKPHVTAEGSVAMHVKVNRDEPDFTQTSARGDPTILKREAETELLVMDGHTAVIGGIFTRNTGRNLDQVPFFGDIPVLGVLFQRRRASDVRGELVIFLTPRIVNRAEALGH